MEDPKQQKDGPGVGYELLWANPYLPGLGYYNMDPWAYEPNTGFLIAPARLWQPDACWIKQTPRGFESQRCPANVQTAMAAFGKLTVRPLEGRCLTVKHDLNRTVILSGLKPGAVLTWQSAEAKRSGTADPSGLFLLPYSMLTERCASRSSGIGLRPLRARVSPIAESGKRTLDTLVFSFCAQYHALSHGAETNCMIAATQIRPGMVIKFNNELHSVFSMVHRTPRQPSRLCSSQDAQPAYRVDDRAPVLL